MYDKQMQGKVINSSCCNKPAIFDNSSSYLSGLATEVTMFSVARKDDIMNNINLKRQDNSIDILNLPTFISEDKANMVNSISCFNDYITNLPTCLLNSKLVSIILLSYNSKNDLSECIPSINLQKYTNYEIIVVDNASTDGSEEFIRTNYPEIKIVQIGKNIGYSAGNNAGLEIAKGEYIIILNPDTILDPEWLSELINPLKSDNKIVATTSKVLLYNQKDKINTCALANHYTGLAFCRGMNRPANEFKNFETVAALSGCSFAIKREVLNYLHGFDPDFFMYEEDTDLSWRIRFAGGKIMYVPTSIVYHKFKFSITPLKEFYLERNRHLILLKLLDLRTLIFLFPSLIITEIITMGYAILNGPRYVKSKLDAYWWIIINSKMVINKRKDSITNKIISDKEFFKLLDWNIPFEQITSYKTEHTISDKLYKIANLILNFFYKKYYKIIKAMV
jgi:GT2 family glycosyltransferase